MIVEGDETKKTGDDGTLKRPSWEILAALVGYVTSAEAAIQLVGYHVLDNPKDNIPRGVRLWIAGAYLALFFLGGAWTLVSLSVSPPNVSRDDRALRAYRRAKRVRVFRTLGLSLIKDALLSVLGVRIDSCFKRYSHWPQKPDYFDRIDRFTFDDESIQFEYPKRLTHIEYRVARDEEREFEPAQKLRWGDLPHRSLTLTSTHGVLWTMGYLLTFGWLRQIK